jgi:hypothetical protein
MKYTEEEWAALNNAISLSKGKLFKTGWDNWLLKVNGISYPIHQQHSFWLTIWGEEGMELNFERQGSEVILKANEPDIHEYTQD